MLKIHKLLSKKKLFKIGATSFLGACLFLGFCALTYTPELSHAETVETRPEAHPNLSDITYMQDITQEICANTKIADAVGNYQYQLKDSRDQKKYWVARLADGNCWMTQNLDLNITAEGLKAEDTDILEDWNATTNPTYPPVATYVGSVSREFTGNGGVVASLDPGVKICTGYGNGCVEPTSESYDEHYLQGNFYTFNAATAGKGASVTTADDRVENSSICPKNWKLPLAYSVTSNAKDNVSGSFYYLLGRYGLARSTSSGAEVDGITYSVSGSPLYFVYGGIASLNSLSSAGSSGSYWASTVYSESHAYALLFNTTTTSSALLERGKGRSIRCVVLGRKAEDNVEIMVNPLISLDVAREVTVEKSESNPSTANLDVEVVSNQSYKIQLSAENPNLTSTTSTTTIPSKGGALTTAVNAWGVRLSTNKSYTLVSSNLKTFYTSTSAAAVTTPFIIGISTVPDLPGGEYSTDLTVTAVQY